METIQQQIGALQVIVAKQQVSVKRQRLLNIALLGIIVAGGFIAAVRPAGDASFDTITCKGWRVVDKDGKTRITAFTNPDGQASVQWLDKDGKQRILAGTDPNGEASVTWLDKDEKERISAATFASGNAIVQWLDEDGKRRISASTNHYGTAFMNWLDKDGKLRISAGTHLSGNAGVTWFDKDEERISASTSPDGTVFLPTEDLNPPKKP